MVKKTFLPAWIFAAVGLFLYSFTQIDLSLTFSQASIFQTLQRDIFQYIGYFNRPISTYIYVVILGIFFGLYGWSLYLISRKKLSKRLLWVTILIVSFILLFSYNAFSYDLFNYIFDAKIITHYNKNPYFHKALDFPGDPMLSFMHWTHRVYPYGPLWLGLTVPLSYIGLGYFIITYYLFKMLMTGAYLATAYFIYKISEKTHGDSLFSLAFFALNPLVIIESLVSVHNDIVMIVFAIFAIYLLFLKRTFFSSLSIIISVGIKFATIFLIPAYLFFIFSKKKNFEVFFYLSLLLMVIPFIFVIQRTTYQPWYLLYLIPFSAFLGRKYYILISTIVLSLFSLIQYIPYLYLGNWDPPVPTVLYWMSISGVIFSIVLCGIYAIKMKIQ